MARGKLRVYLGAAPGVGKTYAMLNEGRRRKGRGATVVVGYLETHGRKHTSEQLGDLELLPRQRITHKGSTFEEMDIDAVLARKPDIALVDELAHTNVPGSRNTKRWQDVNELLAAGIDVISTVNVQHIESVNDVVERITGVVQRETIPDAVVRGADQIELVDMSPEALRRRMAHGNIYAAEKVDAALTNYFREGNLGALRELALLWVADQVDIALEAYRERNGINKQWETRERVIVALTGAPGSENLIRRAARIAGRSHGDLVGVHIVNQQGLAARRDDLLAQHRRLLEEVGGEYHEIAGTDVGAALVNFALAENGTQIVLGSSRSNRIQELTRGSVINRVIRLSGTIDVHVISHEPSAQTMHLPAVPRRRATVGRRRLVLAWVLTIIGIPALTATMLRIPDHAGLPTVIIVFLLFVVVDAAIGGTAPSIAAAIISSLAVNWFFTPPVHTFTIATAENALAFATYVITAFIVSMLVSIATRRTAEAARATAEAETLSSLASHVVDVDPLPALMEHLRRSFGFSGVALLRRIDGGWAPEASVGEPALDPDQADEVQSVGNDLMLTLAGRALAPEDRRLLNAFAANLAMALDRRALQRRAAQAAALGEANELRSALLQAVSHDLRTPLAGIKASVDSLRQTDVQWTPEETADFLATVESETDRLTNLVDNLLDMSRINASAVSPTLRPTSLEEVVPAAVASLGLRARTVDIDVPETLPLLMADPDLLERVVANLVDNALAYGDDKPVRVEAGVVQKRVLLRIIDRGHGIPEGDRERVFKPFQRLNDATPRRGAGVGLGLAVARGFTRSMGATLSIEDTPGGGATMVIELEVAE